jgi:hypothetical protein
MLTKKRIGFIFGTVALGALLGVSGVQASSTSDRSAGILFWPKVVSDVVGVCVGGQNDGRPCSIAGGCGTSPESYCEQKDTVVQVGYRRPVSGSGSVAALHCFYVNANSHCTNTGDVCLSSADCAIGATTFQGTCRPDWSELNFDVRVTPNQPLVWRVSEGLDDAPCDDFFDSCRGNEGTRIPPAPEPSFIGQLVCLQADPNSAARHPATCTGGAACNQDIFGQATIEEIGLAPANSVDPRSYNAVGLLPTGRNDGDGNLVLGSEYAGCPSVLLFNHLFDGAVDPISGEYEAASDLTLVTCGQDFLTQVVTPVTAQFLVYNEFEQRFSTSRQVDCLLDSPISRLDTTQPSRSIFSAGVSGTLAGHTRIRGVGGGLLGVASVALTEPQGLTTPTAPLASQGAAYNLNQSGERAGTETISIP